MDFWLPTYLASFFLSSTKKISQQDQIANHSIRKQVLPSLSSLGSSRTLFTQQKEKNQIISLKK